MSVHTAVTAARLSRRELLHQQRHGACLGAILLQPDHLAVDHIRQYGPELLAFAAALNLIEAKMARPFLRPCAIPVGEKRLLRSARFAPAHAVPHRGMARRHRLTIHADLLPQPPGDASLRGRELDALGPDPAVPAIHSRLAIHQRHEVRRPGQVIPRAIPCRPYATGAPAAATARIAARPAPLHTNLDATCRVTVTVLSLNSLHAESGQSQNPVVRHRDHLSYGI
jgi:hypothetical protein